ncbi:MAG: glycosyltransferase [Candidatus Acidiferrales bacterium]
MRILKVVQAYYPFQEKGGPVVKVRALANGLSRRGHQVTVLTADLGIKGHNGFRTQVERGPWGFRHREDQVETIYLSTLGHRRALTFNPGVIGFCRESLDQFDVVHFYGLYDLLGPAVGYFSRQQGIPYIVEPMGMFQPIVRSLRMKRAYHRVLGKPLVRGARFLIATSRQEKEELLAGGIDDSRVVVRRNGVDVPETLPDRGEFRRRWNIDAQTKVVLFLGRLVSKKSPDLLIEAFAAWRRNSAGTAEAVLALAGPKEENDGYAGQLKQLAKKLDIAESVRMIGPLYDDAKWQAYRDADVFVLPSQNENFGNTAAESAACGTPVIVTNRCGIASYVEGAGIVINHEVSELERALERVLGDSEFHQRCCLGCAEMAARLSWNGPLDEMEAVYFRCVSGNTASRADR